MKHATPTALDQLEPLLRELRTIEGMIEKRRGVFYRGSQAFLHFHEDPAGFFADARTETAGLSDAQGWQRFSVNGARERKAFVAAIRAVLRSQRERRSKS